MIGLGVVTAMVHSWSPFGTYTASGTCLARGRSRLRIQPTASHASTVTGITAVYTWSSSSTSVASLGGPFSLGRVAATSQEEIALGLISVIAEVCSSVTFRIYTALAT
jgi:hypothetical protein